MPQFAAVVCGLFVVYLLRVDARRTDVSGALWIPLVWMFLSGSKFVSVWLNFSAAPDSDPYMEGSPLDAAVFSALMAAGVIALLRRRLNWGQLVRQNGWIWGFFLLGAASIVWSETPFITSKRLLKALGTVIMALVILTENEPYVAVGVVLRRLAFLTLPLSVVFIKY